MLSRISDHIMRLRHTLGLPIRLGNSEFQLAGYISNNLQLNTGFEEDVAIVMARELERPGAVLDVGANLGQTLGSILKVDPSRSYIGFEPQIAACHFVNRFIRDNRLANAIVLPIGLSLETQMRRFWSVGEADTMAVLSGDATARQKQSLQPARATMF